MIKFIGKKGDRAKKNYWTIPAGFLELNESTQEGAIREVREEANAEIDVEGLISVIDIVHISQVYIIYLSQLRGDSFSPGIESLDVKLFKEEEIPWEESPLNLLKNFGLFI